MLNIHPCISSRADPGSHLVTHSRTVQSPAHVVPQRDDSQFVDIVSWITASHLRIGVPIAWLWLLVTACFADAFQNPAACWESLPGIRTGVTVRAFSSSHPSGNTYRDYKNYVCQAASQRELAFSQGAQGMLVHLWTTGENGWWPGNLRLFLGDTSVPTYARSLRDYFASSQFPHLHPSWDTAYFARWAFPCLPFDSVFKATVDTLPHWYQFTCHLYRNAVSSERMSESEVHAWNNILAQRPGAFPGSDSGALVERATASLNPGDTQTVFSANGPGVLRVVRIRLDAARSFTVLDSMRVIVRVDDLDTPSVDVSAPVFFGALRGSTISSARGLPCGWDSIWLYNFFPMPFGRTVAISLVNESMGPLPVETCVRWSPDTTLNSGRLGYFRIQNNPGSTVAVGDPDFVHLATQGAGHIVGIIGGVGPSQEGNYRFYIDGSRTPAIETTGGEDYYCHAYGIKPDLQTPLHGGLSSATAYRFHISDYIPFQQSILVSQDHSLWWTHDVAGSYRSAVFYYWQPTPVLRLADSIDIGDTVSERTHNYSISGAHTRMQRDSACYEGNYNRPFPDMGRWTDGETHFRVSIDPHNDGVRLRKRMSNLTYHQTVDVYVDGDFAGRWFEQGSRYCLTYAPTTWDSIPNRFRDAEFELPAQFTRGKASLGLTMRAVQAVALDPPDSGMVSEYAYWVFVHARAAADPVTSAPPLPRRLSAAVPRATIRADMLEIAATELALRIRVMDVRGRTILTRQHAGGTDARVPLNALPSGTYLVRVELNGGGLLLLHRLTTCR